jgi:hypothetical protein
MDERCTMEKFNCWDGGIQFRFENGFTLSILNEPAPEGGLVDCPFVEIAVFFSTEKPGRSYVNLGTSLDCFDGNMSYHGWELETIKVTPHQLVKYLAAVEKFKPIDLPQIRSVIGDGPSQLSYQLGRLRWINEWNKGR